MTEKKLDACEILNVARGAGGPDALGTAVAEYIGGATDEQISALNQALTAQRGLVKAVQMCLASERDTRHMLAQLAKTKASPAAIKRAMQRLEAKGIASSESVGNAGGSV